MTPDRGDGRPPGDVRGVGPRPPDTPGAATPPPHDDPRARTAIRVAWRGGLALGVLMAAVAALSGLGGAVGAAFFLLGVGSACAAAALYAVVTGAIDAVRERPVGRQRVIAAVTTGALSLLLLVLSLAGLGAADR